MCSWCVCRVCSPTLASSPLLTRHTFPSIQRASITSLLLSVCRKRGVTRFSCSASENTRVHDRWLRSQITLHPHANARWNWQLAISVTRPSLFSLFSYQAHTILALVSFFSRFFALFSLTQTPNASVTKTLRLTLQSPIAKSEDTSSPARKINFSSLLLREASRITPISRGFDGSLLRVLRTCENKNIAFLGREVDATLFTRLRKENFRNIFAKCSPTLHQVSRFSIVIVYNQLNRIYLRWYIIHYKIKFYYIISER